MSGIQESNHYVSLLESWSGRRDSNPRPSAPKFDLQRIFNDLPGAGWHPKSFKGTKRNSYCGAKVGLFTPPT
jgi:hypothetical protein